MFVLPSIIVAYIASIPSLFFILKWMFKGDTNSSVAKPVPSAVATVEAIAIGLLIPVLSSIIPIQRALSKSLGDSLNTARATLSGTVVIIEDKNVRAIPYILMGLLCVCTGTIIYVVLPQALLSENIALVLTIFFGILIAMILGLTLLTANVRSPIETLIVYLLLFWERSSMVTLLRKNLMAHRARNKMTSIIYALTLGCVIFLCVSLNLVIDSV